MISSLGHDEAHDRAFIWNMMCCIWTHNHLPEMIDLPFKDIVSAADANVPPTPAPTESTPTIRELYRSAGIGEWVKATAKVKLPNYPQMSYSVGDIMQVTGLWENGEGIYSGFKKLFHSEYVVLEGYQP